MKFECKFPTVEEAQVILQQAYEQNPGQWAEHSKVVARVAKTIAEACGLDQDRVYILGLLHDIGRYEGVSGLHHIYAGYEKMSNLGYEGVARICLSHSFPYQDIGAFGGGTWDCSEKEIDEIKQFLAQTVWDDYDKLIQLGDAMALPRGVCLIDVRINDIVRRYGFDEYTLKKWDAIFSLKKYFDTRCNMNIYDLFYDEIREVSFT